MAANYLQLVNKLRDRFNEVHLDDTNWSTVVGFDQFSKDAINYAYHDILNAEMEWPFLHQETSLTTVPGVQRYPVTTTNSNVIKEIDWDSFFIAPNDVVSQIANEAATIPAVAPYMVSPVNLASWNSDLGVVYVVNQIAFIPVDRDPLVGQYTIKNGNYYFNAADAGLAVLLNYRTAANSLINVNTAQPLSYMDYDLWRQTRLQIDLNDITLGSFSKPLSVFKTQNLGEVGLTPVPDKIYIVDFEVWVDAFDMGATTDIPTLPDRFNQVLLDGATKYCYEFREDPPAAQQADARFKAGIARMRIELINAQSSMRTGLQWRNGRFDYTLNTL